MQINQSYNRSHQQSFGAFHIHAGVKEALQKRASATDIEEIAKLITEQKLNKNVDITLYTTKSTKLGANIFPKDFKTSVATKQPQEGLFYRLRSPLKFIKSICKKADKMSENIELENTKRQALSNIE